MNKVYVNRMYSVTDLMTYSANRLNLFGNSRREVTNKLDAISVPTPFLPVFKPYLNRTFTNTDRGLSIIPIVDLLRLVASFVGRFRKNRMQIVCETRGAK